MATRAKNRRRRIIEVGKYSIVEIGNSRAVCCMGPPLDDREFPNGIGDDVSVEFREEGPDGVPEVVLKPNDVGQH